MLIVGQVLCQMVNGRYLSYLRMTGDLMSRIWKQVATISRDNVGHYDTLTWGRLSSLPFYQVSQHVQKTSMLRSR